MSVGGPLLAGAEAQSPGGEPRSGPCGKDTRPERDLPLPRAGPKGRARIWGRPRVEDARVGASRHGKTTFAGFVDEPATVKVNGQAAKVMSTDGGAPYKFEALVNLDAGTNTVVVEAKDGQNNTATKTYAVTTSGNGKRFEYDGVAARAG